MAVSRALSLPMSPPADAAMRVGRLVADRALASYRARLQRMRAIGEREPSLVTPEWRAKLARAGSHESGWVEACALVDRACRQTLGIAPYDTQWLATLAMLDGKLVEMATGEGKTLATGLAAVLAALAGRRVQVLTANAYLVARDAAELAPLFASLGLTLATADEAHPLERRREAYRADVVYATARTIVFDALRDEVVAQGQTGALIVGARVLMEGAHAMPVLPRPDMVLIDEADSILIDEATIPLIISSPRPSPVARVRTLQAWKLACGLREGVDYTLDEATRAVTLHPQDLPAPGGAWINSHHRDEWLEMALKARHFYQRDRDYVVRDDGICLIDQITGRIADGRQWGRGLHGLVAMKEKLPLPPETVTVAQTTYLAYFQRYRTMGGMSGTLQELAAELARSYRLAFVRIPLRRPCRRERLPLRLFADEASLHVALVARVAELTKGGRPVLIGTDSVARSREVSLALAAAGIAHQVLNAEQSAEEAHIVAAAGQAGVVTVATNVAGRGTDIRLAPEVAAAGGLHVLSLQANPSPRQDRQLIGRCARQGDPGSAEQWHCLARMREESMPLAALLSRLHALFGIAAARPFLPLSRFLHQSARAAVARRQRARLREGTRYWDRHLPTSSTDTRK